MPPTRITDPALTGTVGGGIPEDGDLRPPMVILPAHRHVQVLPMVEEARRFGWRVVDLELTDGVIPRGCRLVGAIAGLPLDHPAVADLLRLDCPLVRIGNLPHPLDDRFPAVLLDYDAAGRLAAEHFAERSFRELAFVGHDPWSDARTLYDAFSRRAQALGCTCHLLRLTPARPEARSERFIRRSQRIIEWLRGLPKPVGLLAYNDRMAARFCAMCDAGGLPVPEAVAIIGVGNDVARCETASVPLSAVDTGAGRAHREAMRLLHRLTRGERVTGAAVIPPGGVVERHSTNVLAVPDPLVAHALRFIWDTLAAPLSVDLLARRAGVSRRTLERRFHACLGRGVKQEVDRKRLETACALLRSTDLSVAEVADRTGYGSAGALYRAFRIAMGTTPRRYRCRKTQ